MSDGKDNDCDGEIDDGISGTTKWYLDADGDGFGDPTQSTEASEQPPEYVADDTDCDDGDDTIYPGAPELCDGKDNDCDGIVDRAIPTWYRDADEDGYGDPDRSVRACDQPPGFVSNKNDCDGGDDTIYPGAPELCDGKDNDCDGLVDEEAPAWYRDADRDGFGDPNVSLQGCEQPDGYVPNSDDPDDSDSDLPGLIQPPIDPPVCPLAAMFLLTLTIVGLVPSRPAGQHRRRESER